MDPDAAAALIAAVDDRDRALWATAFYAGLRRGELQALTWRNIDLQRGLITVTKSWDQRVGLIGPKSRSGERNVPLTKTLRRELAAHRLKSSRPATGYVFVGGTGRPFDPVGLLSRARRRWQAAGLAGVTLHECRHSYAAFMIAAGVNAKALSTYMGHSTITVTLDRYGHLLPGNEHHAAGLLDALLDAGATGR